MKKTIAVLGGTGGLGTKLVPLLKTKYNVIKLGSKDVNVLELSSLQEFFSEHDIDIVLNMFGKEYDTYLGKIDNNNINEVYEMLNINILGTVNVLASCIPKMISKNWGRVISISSILSEMNVPKASLYSASKAFIDRLISSANKENIRFGVTCNSIQLGYWDGGMRERLSPEFSEIAKNKIGLKRWGTTEELYNSINYIIDNEYVCGINLKLDGGI